MSNVPDQPLPDWWNKLSPEERAAFQRIMGEHWRPGDKLEDDVAQALAETRSRIREIGERALKKLREGGNNEK
jgi:DNA-directed RNA polymerase sigma subunit (sigma70/sigma32)